MKRKTNLFYTEGPDSKFLTFSNYAESMTGNFLSVHTKIFPSRFLCLSINGLNSKSKKSFIKFLVAYYENKLAFLRDNVENVEKEICPFAYLMEGLSKILFVNEDTGENEIHIDSATNEILFNDDPDVTDINLYAADITEQDYNGTYTDIICTIDLNEIKKCSIYLNTEESEIISIDDAPENIYGWDDISLIPGYENVTPIFDEIGEGKLTSYKINTNVETLGFKNIESLDYIKFNVIIPLYELTDINYNTNDTILGYDDYNETLESYMVYIDNSNRYRHNVPLGIWLNCESNDDTFIEISRDSTTKMSPVWSLLISTQFKPFPYSTKYEIDAINTDKGAAFSTFSQVLLRLNSVINKFERANDRISDLETRLHNIQTTLNNISSVQSLDNVNSKINALENTYQTDMTSFKEEVRSIIENLKWKYQ